MLKTFLEKVATIFKTLEPAKGTLLLKVRGLCSPDIVNPPLALIMKTIEPNVTYVKLPLELRNQRTFAVKVRYFSLIPSWNSDIKASHSREPMGFWMWPERRIRRETRTPSTTWRS